MLMRLVQLESWNFDSLRTLCILEDESMMVLSTIYLKVIIVGNIKIQMQHH